METQLHAKYSIWFVALVGVFVTCLITANLAAVKLVNILGFIVPAGIVIFPVSYIIGDVLTEVYGYRQARRVIWLGFLCNLLTVTGIWIAQILPSASFWDGQVAYERILGFTPRLLLASFIAYLVGEFANSFVIAKLKIATNGRFLWVRTIGSTIVGEGLDSAIFILIAFTGIIATNDLMTTILTQWLFKVGYEVVATPFTYVVVAFFKRKENIDVYDKDISFNPINFKV